MGKGDVKSFIGKLFRKSYGKYRPRKKKKRGNAAHAYRSKRMEVTSLAPTPLQKGDIVWPNAKENHPHPIVFLGKEDAYSSKAAILSSKPTGANIAMKREYFCSSSEYSFPQTKQNYLITEYSFIKKDEWINSRKVGRLTDEGIKFVEANTPKEPTYWAKSIKALASKEHD
jgi:ribosomal small subunit protein bTHX